MEALSGVKGENSIKLFGPDLGTLEDAAFRIKAALRDIPGVQNAGVFRIQGQSNLEFPVDRQKCAAWKVSATDIQGIIEAAVGGKPATQVQEGEKLFPLVVRVAAPLSRGRIEHPGNPRAGGERGDSGRRRNGHVHPNHRGGHRPFTHGHLVTGSFGDRECLQCAAAFDGRPAAAARRSRHAP